MFSGMESNRRQNHREIQEAVGRAALSNVRMMAKLDVAEESIEYSDTEIADKLARRKEIDQRCSRRLGIKGPVEWVQLADDVGESRDRPREAGSCIVSKAAAYVFHP